MCQGGWGGGGGGGLGCWVVLVGGGWHKATGSFKRRLGGDWVRVRERWTAVVGKWEEQLL